MKRALKVLAVLWAVALVGWAVASAQGWLGNDEAGAAPGQTPAPSAAKGSAADEEAPATAPPPGPAPALPATKSFVRDGAEPAGTKADAPLRPHNDRGVPAKNEAPPAEGPPTQLPRLLPSTKSGLIGGPDGLDPALGFRVGSGAPGPTNPPPEAPEVPSAPPQDAEEQ